MLFATLLLLISTSSSANLIGRQVYVEECENGQIIAPSNTAIPISCVASATSGLSSSLTTQYFRLSNSTTISHYSTSPNNRLSLTTIGGVPTSSSHPSLESTRSGDTSTYSTSVNTYNHAHSESTNSLGSSLSIPSGTSQAFFGLNATSSSSASSYMSSPSMTNSGNTSSQSTSQLDFLVSLSSSGSRSKYRGTGTASWNSISNLEHTTVSSLWTSPELRGPSRASLSNTYPPSSLLTETSSSLFVSSATPGSTSSQANQSSRYSSSISPAQTFQTLMLNNSATPANFSRGTSSTYRLTTDSAAVPTLTTTVPSSTNTGITSELGLSGNIIRSNVGSPSSSSTTRVATNGANTQTTISIPDTTPASITGFSQSANTASLGNWPATITFCSESNGQPVVGYAFVTTHSGGLSSVTNSIPSQTLISTSTGLACAGEVAVISNGLTTTIELSTLPSATPYEESAAAASVEVLTQSGVPVVYDIETLSGYQNSQPVLISTDFVEVVNGQTTTQAGCKTSPAHCFFYKADREHRDNSRCSRAPPERKKTDLEKYNRVAHRLPWTYRGPQNRALENHWRYLGMYWGSGSL